MRSAKWTKRLAVQGIIMAVAQASIAYADAPAAKWYDTVGLSGYLQSSYTGNFSASPHNKTNIGRQFDTNANSFNFNTFLLQVAKPVGDSDHYGFTVRLRTGQDAASISGGGSLFVQEAYLTYAVPATKLSITGGKFVTSEGVEVVDTVANPNFSEGLLFFAAEPIAHTGLKANYTFSDKINATIGVVNGWDSLPGNQGSPDVNDNKTILWQVATTPTKQITWSFQGLYGDELAPSLTSGAPAPSDHSKRLSLDTVVGFNPMDKLSLAAQGNWGEQTKDPATTNSNGTTHWLGAGVWATLPETSKCSTSLRFEVLSDQNNANRFGVATPSPFLDGTNNQTVKEFTVTQKHMLTPAMGVRAEYRHDWSNQAYFVRSDGSAVRNQNTVSADWFVTF